jgi:hypothetical protein
MVKEVIGNMQEKRVADVSGMSASPMTSQHRGMEQPPGVLLTRWPAQTHQYFS